MTWIIALVLTEHLDLRGAAHVGQSMGGGEVVHYWSVTAKTGLQKR
jgi:hypothetical protein